MKRSEAIRKLRAILANLHDIGDKPSDFGALPCAAVDREVVNLEAVDREVVNLEAIILRMERRPKGDYDVIVSSGAKNSHQPHHYSIRARSLTKAARKAAKLFDADMPPGQPYAAAIVAQDSDGDSLQVTVEVDVKSVFNYSGCRMNNVVKAGVDA